MVHTHQGPAVVGMAVIAGRMGLHMTDGLDTRGDLADAIMTTFAGPGYALEYATDMAGFTTQATMLAGEKKTGTIMVERLGFRIGCQRR